MSRLLKQSTVWKHNVSRVELRGDDRPREDRDPAHAADPARAADPSIAADPAYIHLSHLEQLVNVPRA